MNDRKNILETVHAQVFNVAANLPPNLVLALRQTLNASLSGGDDYRQFRQQLLAMPEMAG